MALDLTRFDRFDERSDPPLRVDLISTADVARSSRTRRHIYADGRVRRWHSDHGGPWIEQVAD